MFAFSEDTTIIFWVLIVFSSFGLGYFLSSIASGLDPLYDWIRKQFSPYNEDLEKGFFISGIQMIGESTIWKFIRR
ncbi:MAG: hypothetical protein IPP79_19745 [Chitinophagaceae bacterium]|nr:hypothetical protein [Chitinophagaceae bacterium]